MGGIMRNKKGQVGGMLMFFIVLIVLAVVGLLIGFGAYFFNTTLTPTINELKGIGSIDAGTNMTEITENSTFGSETIVNNFSWITGVLYAIMIIGSLGFAFYMRSSDNKRLIFFYFGLLILLILISILVSNSYENYYTNGDDLANYLHTLPLLSWFVLNSPLIFAIIGIISGIIMFSGGSDEDIVG